MKLEHWEQAKKILPKLRQLPVEERLAFLADVSKGDPELFEELHSFLDADAEAISFLDAPPIRLLEEELAPLSEGSQVGSYRLIKTLGTGGMGVVYLARRIGEEFEREVALKVLQVGQTSPEAEKRFLREMGILAKLHHPNIARLFEGGRTDDGRLYYLMEHVEGQAIDSYCREHRLSLEQRLRLFQKVCAAVQYAHTQLVVHRDIKPSNVLVTEDGEPKLLDFGIARPLEETGSAPRVPTGTGHKLLTPEYASPEQLSGQHIGTQSDVYSLGVLLYQLLSGTKPFRAAGQSLEEFLQEVLQKPPAPPSVAAAGTRVPREAVGAQKGWQRHLKGDLDRIILVALRKEPERRYGSGQQLSDDLDRYLEGRPVQARADTWGYKAGKLVGRHPWKIAVTALVILASVASSFVMTQQRDQVIRERDRAREATTFLVNLFREADPQDIKASNISALELLEHGSEVLLTTSTMDPQLRTDLLMSIGSVYSDLELAEQALPLHLASLEALRAAGETETAEYGEELSNTALTYYYMGRYDESEELYRQSSTVFDKALPSKFDQRNASLKNNFAGLLLAQGRHEEAEELFREALALRTHLLGAHDPEVLEAKNNLAATLTMQSKYEEAEALFRELLAIRQKELSPTDRNLASSLHNLGWNLSSQERYEEALEFQERGLDIELQAFDLPHPSVARTLLNICGTLEKLLRQEEAEERCREAVQMLTAVYGPDHPETAIAQHNLARTLFTAGKYNQALEACEAGLAGRRASLPADHPHIAHSLSLIGEIREAQGFFKEAEAIHRESLERRRASSAGQDHIDLLNGIEKLGYFLKRRGESQESRQLLTQATELSDRLFGPQSERSRTLRTALEELH
ncbi:MAG: serine/threonine protein kinase [Acidobacteria bacterium]|nr:serine/threonine protein kinase [Acidobacteriota bacterium]